MNRWSFKNIIGGDTSLWMMIVLLSLWSLLVIYSSTGSLAYAVNDGVTTEYLQKQIYIVIFSFIVIICAHKIPMEFFFKQAFPIFIAGIVLMLLTFVIGVEYNGEKRWLPIPGTDVTFQPSDLLKITLVIYLAAQLSVRQKTMKEIKIIPPLTDLITGSNKRNSKRIIYRETIPIIFPIALSCLLVAITNLSTALIMYATSLIILILGRVRWVEIWKLLTVTITVFMLFVAILKIFNVGRVDTWEKRLTRFFVKEKPTTEYVMDKDTYQSYQAQIAIASSWKGGKGVGKSTQRSNLPHPYSDYAFAFIVEEYGIIGAFMLISFYFIIFYRAMVISMKTSRSFTNFLVLALGLVITLQAVIHIGVSVGIMPVTGQPLPIISKGGSSTVFTCIMFGIILGASREINEAKRLEKIRAESDEAEQLGAVIIDPDHEIATEPKDEIRIDGIVWNYGKENQNNS